MRTHQRPITLLILIFFLLLLGTIPGEGKVLEETWLCGFGWNANTESDLAGYKFYAGTISKNYGTPVDVGNVTEVTCQQAQTAGIGEWFVAVSAYDTSDNESPVSEEVRLEVIPNQPPPKPILQVIDLEGMKIKLEVCCLIVATDKTYEVGSNLQIGDKIYIDREYTYLSGPDYLLHGSYIRTANGDKKREGDNHLQFSVNTKVWVYVGFDDRISQKPDWLNAFKNTDEFIETSDQILRLYRQAFNAETVSLGGNSGSTQSSHYTIFIIPQ